MKDPFKAQFLAAADIWICDSSEVEVRYLAKQTAEGSVLLAASVDVNPLSTLPDLISFVETNDILAGQVRLGGQSKEEILRIVECAAEGLIEAAGQKFALFSKRPYNYHSELVHGDRWFEALHLRLGASLDHNPSQSYLEQCKVDSILRQCDPPFDGLADLAASLGLRDPLQFHEASTISIRVKPPVDIDCSRSTLDDRSLRVRMYANPHFDLGKFQVSISGRPNGPSAIRQRITSKISWEGEPGDVSRGDVLIDLRNTDSVLAMLTIGDLTVRRCWIRDPAGAENMRLVAVQRFDADLRQIRNALYESADGARFEKGVAALLFLMGFAPSLQIETDAPDIILTTPSGRIVLVECTTRIADFSSKLGKLVDRRGALLKAVRDADSQTGVEAMLVCSLPRNQVVARVDELREHSVVLLTKEDVGALLMRVRDDVDSDKCMDGFIADLNRAPFLSH